MQYQRTYFHCGDHLKETLSREIAETYFSVLPVNVLVLLIKRAG